MEVVNLAEKFGRFEDYWSPKIAGELNDSYVKLAKLHGEFVWHHHDDEDEMFLVVRGRLLMKLRDRDLEVNEGEFLIVPRGVEHKPVAEEEVHVVLIEPKTTLNTGNVRNERTVETLDRLDGNDQALAALPRGVHMGGRPLPTRDELYDR